MVGARIILVAQILLYSGLDPQTSPESREAVLVSNKTIMIGAPLEWAYPPDIIICNTSDVKVSTVIRATEFWKKLGYKFGDIRVAERDDYICAMGKPPLNQILIDIPSQGFQFGKHLGTTRTWHYTESSLAIRAKIEIVKGWGNAARVLEHEIGHAFGWRDNSKTGHIMNGSWSLSGLNSQGLRKLEIPE